MAELAEPLAKELGLILWDVVFEKEGASWYLRVYIDKEDGVEIDDCEAFSRPFNKILDDEDFIEQSYFFEVCSPGLARQLRKKEHFERYKGEVVRARLIRALDGEKEIRGTLDDFDKDSVTIGGKQVKLSDTAHIKLCDDDDLFG